MQYETMTNCLEESQNRKHHIKCTRSISAMYGGKSLKRRAHFDFFHRSIKHVLCMLLETKNKKMTEVQRNKKHMM